MPQPERRRVLLAGRDDLFDEVGTALEQAGAEVRALKDPRDDEVQEALRTRPDAVCAVARDDALPLRLALLVRHVDGEVPLVATVFDDEMAAQLQQAVPHMELTSMADVVAPALAGPCLSADLLAAWPDGDDVIGIRAEGEELTGDRREKPSTSIPRALATSIFAPYDRSARLLFYGLMGLVLMLGIETVGTMTVLDQSFADALYGSTKSLVTVGPNTAVDDGPAWFKVAVVVAMVLTLFSAACFTGGLIERLTSTRLTGLIGQRAVPRRDHVVVVGLGQVGMRLCLLLRECGIAVVALEADGEDESVGQARRLKLPVVIGKGANPQVMRRLSLDRARALAAVTEDDLTNIESAMTARSVNPDLRVILRAGAGGVAEESRSLLRIGHVIDVQRIAGVFIAARTLGEQVTGVVPVADGVHLLLPGGGDERFPPGHRS